MRKIVVAEPAENDLTEGVGFYDRQDGEAGSYFAVTVRGAIRSLAVHHGIHMKRHGVFCLLVPRFPHGIFYRDHHDMTEVIAIVDMRRDPKWIKRQLRTR